MAHWAEIDDTKTVIRVLVGDNNDPNNDEGYQWLLDNLGGTWLKTSYNANTNGFRKHYASIGFTYDQELDAFIPPKPYPSWLLNTDDCTWYCSVPYPTDTPEGIDYIWNEESLAWVEALNQTN
jgi:hypothetical protein